MAQKIDYNLAPVEEVEADLGRGLEAVRLGRNINQTRLAEEAGVSRRTITRLENGKGVSMDTLIRVMRALGLASRLATLLPDASVQPMDRVRFKGRERKRARPTTKKTASQWNWADKTDTQ